MSLLFVCHGNTCRSAIAERLTASWAEQALGAEAVGVRIGSAGLAARDGEPVELRSAAALRSLGGSTGDFRSRRFVPALADEADLVLTMTQRQRRSVLEKTPLGLRRTFVLTEAAALLPLVDVSDMASLAPTARPEELARRLHRARARRPAPPWADIDDPMGRRSSAHREAAQRIAAALRPLADVLFAQPPTPSACRPVASPAIRVTSGGHPSVPRR